MTLIIWFWRKTFSHRISSWRIVFLEPLDRKLRSGEAQWSWASRRQSVGKSTSPYQKTKFACMLCVGSMFSKCYYSAGCRMGKSDLLSPWRVWKKLLKCLNLSFITNIGCFCTFNSGRCACETSAFNLIALIHDGVVVLCVVWQWFFLLVMTLNKGNVKKVPIFHLFFLSVCMFLK